MMTDADAVPLKPCPFCGGDAGMIEGFGPFEGRVQIDCIHCRNATYWWEEVVAVRLWNRRAPASEVQADHIADERKLTGWKFAEESYPDMLRVVATNYEGFRVSEMLREIADKIDAQIRASYTGNQEV